MLVIHQLRETEGSPHPATRYAHRVPRPSIPRHARPLRLLKASLIAGAVYDLVFALLMVVAPDLPERLLELPQPGETFYLWIMATFLCMIAGFYLYAAYDPVSYAGNIRIAIVGRFVGAAAFVVCALRRPDLWGLYPLAAADFAFGLVHALFWRRVRSR